MKMQPHWKKPGRKPRSVAKANYVGKLSFLQTLLLTQLSDTIAKRREDQHKRHKEVAALQPCRLFLPCSTVSKLGKQQQNEKKRQRERFQLGSPTMGCLEELEAAGDIHK